MSIPISLVGAGILALAVVALAGLIIAYRLPPRLRPADITAASDREAFRANLIHTLTLVLVVVGAAVALGQLGTSLDQLHDVRIDRLAAEVANAEQRLLDPNSDEQEQLDAIADLSLLHAKSPDHRFRIERFLLRYVQERAQLNDRSEANDVTDPPLSIQGALEFLVSKGQEQTEAEWLLTGNRRSLVLANLDLRGIALPGATLDGADFSRSLMWGADLQGARMSNSILTGAQLQGAKLQRAVLDGSTLTDADLEDAILTEADLAGADVRGARNINWGQLRDAALACSTQLPVALPPSKQDAARNVQMVLVLRDCLLPRELRIPPNQTVPLHFGSALSEPVAVRVDRLGIEVVLPDRTAVDAQLVTAPTGSYEISSVLAFSPSPLFSTLIAVDAGSLVLELTNGEPSRAEEAPPTVPPAAPAPAIPPQVQDPVAPPLQAAEPPAMHDATPVAAMRSPIPTPTHATVSTDEPFMVEITGGVDEAPGGLDEDPIWASESSLEVAALMPPGVPPAQTGGDQDCADFATPEEAQAFFLAAGGPTLDLHRLDIDGNGIACEVLP